VSRRYEVTLRMRRPPAWLRAYRRWRYRDGSWPHMSSDPWWHHWYAAIIPYRLRWAHRWYASAFGYFWLPCPLCGREFGGHEWRPVAGKVASVPDPLGGPSSSTCICPTCTRAGRGVDVVLEWPAESGSRE
jgi:hypothetical protein